MEDLWIYDKTTKVAEFVKSKRWGYSEIRFFCSMLKRNWQEFLNVQDFTHDVEVANPKREKLMLRL
jgi:hypothetical protein